MNLTANIKIKLISPLAYFYIDKRDEVTFPYSLGAGYFLIESKSAEISQEILDSAKTMSKYDLGLIKGFSYALQYQYKVTSFEVSDLSRTYTFKKVEEDRQRIRMAIGLIKSNNCITSAFHIKESTNTSLVSIAMNHEAASWRYNTDVAFTNSDLKRLKRLVKLVKELEPHTEHRVIKACGYFSRAQFSSDYVIRFLMYVSAIESLFNTGSNEVTESVSLRCSLEIANRIKDRKIIYQKMRGVYKLRSKLVHGQELAGKYKDEANLLGWINDAEHIARESILSITLKGHEKIYRQSHDDLSEHFLNKILR